MLKGVGLELLDDLSPPGHEVVLLLCVGELLHFLTMSLRNCSRLALMESAMIMIMNRLAYITL